jgi:hypothetical protein
MKKDEAQNSSVFYDHDKPVACDLLPPRLASRATNDFMTRLFIAITLLSIAAWPEFASAQEAVSSGSGSGGTSTSSGSSSSSSSGGSTTDLSAGSSSTGAPGAVSNAPSAATAVQSGGGGVGVFSPTPIKLYLSAFGGYDDNVNTNRGSQEGSSYTGGNLILDYTFGDPRLQVILNGGAGGVYYLEHVTGQDYDIDLKAALGINYKASPRLTLGTTLLFDYLTEPNFDSPGGLNSRNGNYFYTLDQFFVSYAWSRRFSTKTSYVFEAYKYDQEPIALFSDRISNTFVNEFQFQMVPTTKLVAEYRYGIISYANEGDIVFPATFNPFTGVFTPAVLLQNDSTTHFALGGIDHIFNPRFTASIRGGAQFRSYDSGGDRTGPYFEGTVNYAVGRRTSVSWNTRYGLEEPEVAGAQSRTTFRTGLHAKFDVTSRVSTTMDAYYVHDDYHSLDIPSAPVPAFSDNTFDIGFSVRYAINSLIAVQAGYHYTDVTSDAAFREYSRNRLSGGLSITF